MSSAGARWRKPTGKAGSGASSKTVPPGLDTSTFFSPSIPAAVKDAVRLMHKVDEAVTMELVSACAQTLQHPDVGFSRQLSARLGEDPELAPLFTGLYMIMSTAVRHRTKASVVEEDLRSMNIPNTIVGRIGTTLRTHRSGLEDMHIQNRVRFPRLEGLHWRVDVTISSSSLLRVFRPSILMRMRLSNGNFKTFEVSVEQFHQLRYNVAKVLRDMQELERHPIMRIALEADKKKFEEDANSSSS
uniref:COMM domain-containing protein 5 n=1 Tax=Rhizochromulina marina TaxID=1034831 RepID=A0A7S2R5K4_9STRA|eukprot:CAMPEP_0118973882 /NCGR_PEP_ID=MMETSP1173-20130426/10958_1 /TAXON_ID=1034831 /ORGANISM="Rhizochromulina marina cf, Strain CCMP1243" /LENGTH=243 /DNA_ID=CAMNT_0006923579 /DNA_START=73 /DNA_END=804 /DNA_ORIENTATION=+